MSQHNTTPFVATEVPPSQPVVVSSKPIDSVSAKSSPLKPQKTYDGGYTGDYPVRLRVGNGGAGQAGLIGAFADAFIRWRVEKFDEKPFKVEWYLGDTTQTLSYLGLGYIDVALTYNEAAELAEVKNRKAVRRELVFIDHFYLVGPPSNPAGLNGDDTVSDMFNKIVLSGNTDVIVPPEDRPPTRFLSRFDKSATNIRESELFIKIGQVPWALAYSSWYHQYPRFPLQALAAASLLGEYTLTDRGTWLSSPPDITAETSLRVFAKGSSEEGTSEGTQEVKAKALLNYCNALLSSMPEERDLAKTFMDWLIAVDGGQLVVSKFEKQGQILYEPAVKV